MEHRVVSQKFTDVSEKHTAYILGGPKSKPSKQPARNKQAVIFNQIVGKLSQDYTASRPRR
jgi:hypothetical protein